MIPDLPERESLTVEFKSDRDKLGDAELIEAVVCMANARGGEIYLGVEDDGTVSGLHRDHRNLDGLAALIGNRTSPSVAVRVDRLEAGSELAARITVPKSSQVVATSDGTIKRRRLKADGTPECVPFLPHEIPARLSSLGSFDASSQPVPEATMQDLDPTERGRLRQFIERFRGDTSLIDLSDEELDGALGLVDRESTGRHVPTLCGLLLIGKESSLNRLVPTHEVAFQVLENEQVRLNEFSRAPLLRGFEWLETLFTPLNPEREVDVGLFRVGVPRIDRRVFREAIANALAHRDYTQLGAVHVRFESNALVVSNPGGFVEGVTEKNLLTTEPRPRNPRLADALKRIGIVERTGRGVDLIFRGVLRYGRSRPDYSRSTEKTVVLRLPVAEADLGFLQVVLEAEEEFPGGTLPIDSLIALSCLRTQRRVSSDELAEAIQKDRRAAKSTLEALVETGLAEAHGRTRARTYTLAAHLYSQLGQGAAYTRQAGLSQLQIEQLVLNHARHHGWVRRSDVVELCRLSDSQASRLLKKLLDQGRLVRQGERRWSRYRLPSSAETNAHRFVNRRS